MPNNCENTLTITGPKADLEAFRQAARKDNNPLEINNFIPMPDSVRNTQRERDWAISAWGTKWGAYECEELEVTDSVLEYIFFTAWGPFGTNVLKVMSARFPFLHLVLDYQEVGNAFKGRTEAHDGSITTNWSRDMTEEELNSEG